MMIVINTVNEEICCHEVWVYSLLKTLKDTAGNDTSSSATHGLLFS